MLGPTSPVPPAITIETTCTLAEVRTDPGKKQDILQAVNTAQVHNFLTDIDTDATGLLTPDVISTSNFIQSINSAAREYTIYKKHLTTYKQKSTRSWGKSMLQSQLDAVQYSIGEVKFKLSDVMAIDLDIPELTAKIKRAADKLVALTEATILLSTLVSRTTAAGLSLKQRVSEMNVAQNKKVYATKNDYLTMHCLVGANTTWVDATSKLDVCVQVRPLSCEQLFVVPMLFQEQAKRGVCFMPVRCILAHFDLPEVLRADLVQQLTETFPVMLLEKNTRQVLVDIHEMVVNGELFEEILTLDDPPVTSQVDTHKEPHLDATEGVYPVPLMETGVEDVERQKPGTKPLTEKYPQIAPILTDFLRTNGFNAQVCTSQCTDISHLQIY